jgi:putative endonuclease
VGKKKIQNLINAAEEYLYLNPQWKRIQFDILSILILKNEPVEYFLIEDVYL